MKIINLLLPLLGSAVWSPVLSADKYPESYISRQIEDARKLTEVDVTKIEPGQLIRIIYVKRPVWIYRRTEKELGYLSKNDSDNLADPRSRNLVQSIEAAYASSISYVWAQLLLVNQPEMERTRYRSVNEEFFIVGGWSPHTGCALTFKPMKNQGNNKVTFYDPCASASFDVAGRIIKGQLSGPAAGQSAKYNLYIPPYRFKNAETLVVGVPKSKALPILHISLEKRYSGMNSTKKLIAASKYNDIETVKLALYEGANAGYYAFRKGSPLDAAIIGGSMEIIKLLITNGARPTPDSLRTAKYVGRTDVIKLINEMQ